MAARRTMAILATVAGTMAGAAGMAQAGAIADLAAGFQTATPAAGWAYMGATNGGGSALADYTPLAWDSASGAYKLSYDAGGSGYFQQVGPAAGGSLTITPGANVWDAYTAAVYTIQPADTPGNVGDNPYVQFSSLSVTVTGASNACLFIETFGPDDALWQGYWGWNLQPGNTYTLANLPQPVDGNDYTNLPWVPGAADAASNYFWLQPGCKVLVGVSNSTADIQFTLDNPAVSVPEPTVLGLSAGASLLLLTRHRKSRAC